MRNKIVLSIGLLALLSFSSKAYAGLYEDMYGLTLHETMLDEVELIVEKFIPKVLNQTVINIQEKHVDMAITSDYTSLCNPDNNDGKPVQYSECLETQNTIVALAKREALIRGVGRDLQIIAHSYESGSSGYTGEKETSIYRDMYEIGKIWESGIDKMTNPIKNIPIRKLPLEDEDRAKEIAEDITEEIRGYLEGGGSNKQEVDNQRLYHAYVGAGWRYRHGVYSVINKYGTCDEDESGEGDESELEYLDIRWCELEELLKDAKNELAPSYFDPPLEPEEIVIFPTENISDDLYLWIRNDDAGLMWKNPLRPVLPGPISSLRNASEGGDYPDPPESPEDDEGICSHPFGKRGYLCRPVEADRCITDDGDNFDANGNEILLTECNPQNIKHTMRATESGPDLCKIGGWRTPVQQDEQVVRDTPQQDPKIRPGKCSNCGIDIYCGNCPFSGGATFPKNDDGVVKICISNTPGIDHKYVVMHEMIHAQQFCDLPPNQALPGDCCTYEYIPYLITCKAMMDDGVLDGIGVSVEECASAMTSGSCGGGDTCNIVDIDQDQLQKLQEAYSPTAEGKSCADAVNNLDPRAASIKESSKKTCDTDCKVEYDNTIGNNLCYIGQCVEESLENHRIIPGRIPFGVQDEAYPWDACTKKDPQLGRLLELPPLSRSMLPAYRGQHLMQHIDTLLCQGNGLPRLTPPALCNFDPRRRTALPVEAFYQMGTSLLSQQGEQQDRAQALQLSLENISARLGQQIYEYYLRKALREFSDIIRAANMITRQIGELDIPDSVCPRAYTGGCSGL